MYLNTGGLGAIPRARAWRDGSTVRIRVPHVIALPPGFSRSAPRYQRGRGIGDAASLLAQEQGTVTNPYLMSPAYLATQAAALQNECQVNPQSGACIVAQMTGDIKTGYNAAADTTLNLQNWCEQNVFNHNTFGDALDTANCTGSTPKAAILSQAQQIAQTGIVNPLATSKGGSDLYGPSSGSGAGVQPIVTLTNTSRPGQPFQVGDNFSLVIRGAPGQPVSGTATQNGTSLGTSQYGTTDQSGVKSITGTMGVANVGSWSELWTVGAAGAPVLNFTVTAAPAGGGGGGGGGNSGGGGGGSTQPPAPPAPGAPVSDLLTSSVTLFGYNIPIWGLGLAVVGGGMLLANVGKGR
jgi:hypothetical protein